MPPAPALSWTALSEISFGKLVQGKLSRHAVSPEHFIDPYPRGVKYLKTCKAIDPDKVIAHIGLPAYQAALHGAKQMDGLPANWLSLLQEAALNYQLGVQLERMVQKLKNGEKVDWGPVQKAIRRHDQGLPQVVQLSQVKPAKSFYEKTGYEPFDTHIGGLPQAGLTVVIGPPGTGKTYLFIALAQAYALRRRKVVMFSLEMLMAHIARRAVTMMKLPRSVTDYIYISDDILSPEDISSVAGRVEDADLVGIDFAELMMVGERTEQAMGEAYWILNTAAKNLGIPFVMLAQQNRASLLDLLPVMGAARYTGMADILAALMIGLYNRSKILRKAEQNGDGQLLLPLQPGNGAQVVIKARHGTAHQGVGAVEVPFSDEKGWGAKAVRWHSLG